MKQSKLEMPKFEQIVVEDNLKDGYWIDAVDINGDGKPDLVASGLAIGELVWYENPSWQKHQIRQLSKPVAMNHADLDGDGFPDLVVCHDYGECMFHCKPEDGKISWLRGAEWKTRQVAGLMATHRLRFGHFTRTDRLQL